MSQLGLGVMIKVLGGNHITAETMTAAIGKTIKELSLGDDDALHFVFTDGTGMRVFDDGQSCCETRYMTTDDDLSAFIGSTFQGAELREAPNQEDECEEHEVQFLIVKTSFGEFTMASHNEHNGYYGGFAIVAKPETGVQG